MQLVEKHILYNWHPSANIEELTKQLDDLIKSQNRNQLHILGDMNINKICFTLTISYQQYITIAYQNY